MTLSPVVAGLIPQFPVTFSPETFLNPPANNRSMKTSISIHQDWQIGAQTVTHDGILTFHDIGALDAQLDEAKIALGEVRSLRQLSETEWAEYWGADQKVSDRNGGIYRLPGRPWRFSREKLDPLGEPAFQGEHNRTVLAELGLSDEQIDGYVVSGALVSASIPEPANQRNAL